MKKGELAKLVCRADYAYGAAGSPPTIPPDATLQFEVELISWTSVKDITGMSPNCILLAFSILNLHLRWWLGEHRWI